MKNTTITFCIAAIFLVFSGAVFAAVPDFSGTWTLDKAKSEGLPAGMNQEMTVKQTGDKLSLETKISVEHGEQSLSDVYTLDGKEMEFSPKAGALTGKGKRTAKRTADGFEVEESGVFDTPNGEVTVKISRKWTLSADGKSLIIEMTSVNPSGTQKSKRIFSKK